MAAGMNSFLIAQGYSGLGMATVVVGAVLNIVLDPVFIFTFDLGVAGAALATVLSQVASCALVLGLLLRRRMPVPLRWGGFSWRVMKRILAFGLVPLSHHRHRQRAAHRAQHGAPALRRARTGDTLVTCATIVQSYLLIITMAHGGHDPWAPSGGQL